MKCFTLAVRTTHRRTKACEFDATIVVYVHRWPCRRFEDERYTVPLAVSPEPENWRTVLEHAIRFEHARGPPAMHETETVNEGADTAPRARQGNMCVRDTHAHKTHLDLEHVTSLVGVLRASEQFSEPRSSA
jgi:hypothetical protein